MCGECHSIEWDTQESSGHGHVYTWIVSHHPTKPDAEPRVVVLVELDEGIRFVSNLARRRAEADVQNGMEVALSIEDVDGVVLPQFRPTAERASDGALPRDRHRRHRPDRVLEALGPQRAAARRARRSRPRSPTPASPPPTSTAR